MLFLAILSMQLFLICSGIASSKKEVIILSSNQLSIGDRNGALCQISLAYCIAAPCEQRMVGEE